MLNRKYLKPITICTAGAFYSLIAFGLIDNLKGPTLPFVCEELKLSYANGGTMFFVMYFGFLIATLFTGPAADLLGRKFIGITSGIFLFISANLYGLSDNHIKILFSIFLLGASLGVTQILANLIIIDLHSKNRGKLLNLLHFTYGFGAISAPFIAGWLLSISVSWHVIYFVMSFAGLFLSFFFLFTKYPKIEKDEGKAAFSHLLEVLTLRHILVYFIVMMYIAVEIGVVSWIVTFLNRVKHFSIFTSSVYLSIFFLLMTFGRLIGSCFVEKTGYLKSLFYTSLLATASLSIGIAGPPSLAFFIPLSGLFFSIIYPTALAFVSGIKETKKSLSLGLFVTSAGMGAIFGASAIGHIGNQYSIYLGFACNIVPMSITFLLILLLFVVENKNS